MRYLIVVASLIVIIGALVGIKASQIGNLMEAGEAMAKAGPPPEIVGSATAREETWETRIAAVGTVATAQGVTLSNDAAGVVSAIRFESGAEVKRGQLLVELDSDLERAQLSSARARLGLARTSAQRTRALVEQKAIPEAQLDADEAALQSAAADVAALEAQIDRKIVRAPFDGKLGIRQVNLGQYLNPGTPITILQASDDNYVDFTLPQQDLEQVAAGMSVRLNDGLAPPRGEATITAIDPTVDPVTRSGRVRAIISKTDGALSPGMFVNVAVILPAARKVTVVPATALVHASFGDSLFVIEEAKDAAGNAVKGPDGSAVRVARQQFVKTGEARGDFVAILDGLKAGDEVVAAGAFKLRNGASVIVNDSVQLDPKLAPQPENR